MQQFNLTHTRGIPLVAAPQSSCVHVLDAARRPGSTNHLLLSIAWFLLAAADYFSEIEIFAVDSHSLLLFLLFDHVRG